MTAQRREEDILAVRSPAVLEGYWNNSAASLDVQENSRLSCQIELVGELDGLVVRITESQIWCH